MSRFTSYYLYQRYEKVGDGEWTPTYPNEYSISGDSENTMPLVIKEQNDANCGYYPPIYQWVDTDDTICILEEGFPTQYLTFKSFSDNNRISFVSYNSNGEIIPGVNTIQYTLDNGSTWSSLTPSNSVTINSGDTIMFKATDLTFNFPYGVGTFNTTGSYEAYGNVMSLVYGDNFIEYIERGIVPNDYYFEDLFRASSGLTSAENLILPTRLRLGCFSGMFQQCNNLITAPSLPSTELASQCYFRMFYHCESLVNAPELPATTLATSCYRYMFERCSSLEIAPDLPAPILTDGCYGQMFYLCYNLNYIKCLATDISATDCTSNWTSGVQTTSGTFVKDATMNNWTINTSYVKSGIPKNWTIQNA